MVMRKDQRQCDNANEAQVQSKSQMMSQPTIQKQEMQ